MLDEFQRLADASPLANPTLTLVSNVTGQAVRKNDVTRGDYWRKHARGTVRFADGVRTAYSLGSRLFLEVGPKPILSALATQSLGDDCVCLPSLSEGHDDCQRMLDTLSRLYLRGVNVDWPGFDRPFARRKVSLPTYPFQRQRHWIEERATKPLTTAASGRARPRRIRTWSNASTVRWATCCLSRGSIRPGIRT